MMREPFASQPHQRESGAALLGVIGIALVLSILTASILSFSLQSAQAVRLNHDHTQALYNARMGVDAAFELIRTDVTSTTMTSATGGTDLATAVNNSLLQLSGKPFAITVYAKTPQASPTSSPSQNTLVMTIVSTGMAGQASVLLTVDATLTATSGSGEGENGKALQVLIPKFPNFPGNSTSFSGSSQNSTSVRINSHGDVSLVVHGMSLSGSGTVFNYPYQQELSGHGSTQNQPVNGNLWIKGNDDLVTATINGNAILTGNGATIQQPVNGDVIVTGNGATIQQPVNGTAIVTGSNATLNGAINGPLLLFGSGSTITGTINQGAIITGNNTTIKATVDCPLIITGNHTTITGTINNGLIVTGNNTIVKGTINGYFNATGTGFIATGKDEVVNGTVNNGITEYNNNVKVNGQLNGQITKFNENPVTVKHSCMGLIKLQFGAPSAGAPTVTMNFSTSKISG